MTTDLTKAIAQRLDNNCLSEKQLEMDLLRLDAIHPVISGNKWFKLKYYLREAIEQHKEGILTFGGPWSNHLVAAACAAAEAGLKSIGCVRGEASIIPSFTLQEAARYGMQLHFLSREQYRTKTVPERVFGEKDLPATYLLVPEGGAGPAGEQGAGEILQLTEPEKYTHIACAIGTGTMFSGIWRQALAGQEITGICVLKGMAAHFDQWLQEQKRSGGIQAAATIFHDYHFGGYAKKNERLLQFMNDLYQHQEVPTDFVYTGKLLYGILDLAERDHFPPQSRILVIHSGGLQGNRSLPPGTLIFN